MSVLSDLLGADGKLAELFLWSLASQVAGALTAPGLASLTQDVNAKHPVIGLEPSVVAQAYARGLISADDAKADAAREGINASRFDLLAALAKVRLAPGDLATAVLRSYMTSAAAEAEAAPQGWSARDFSVLVNLAGDAPGNDQLAQALRRGIIKAEGSGPNAVTFQQGIAEGRLHNKWAPMIQALSDLLLSPADAADAVVRNFLTEAQGAKIAELNGMSQGDFTTLTHLSGDAPGPQQLAEALRRGAVPAEGKGAGSISFEQGIAEGRLAAKWTPVIKALAQLWPTPTDALRATLQGQVTKEDGKALYERLGGAPEFFQVMFDAEGSSPTPLQLIEMANRGVIPWDGTGPQATSYAQGFLEGPWRDKWAPAFRKMGEYVPPISTVTTLLARGVVDDAEAADLLVKQGMSDRLVSAYIEAGHLEALSSYRGITSGTVINAYKAHILSTDQAREILLSLHFTEHAADLALEYADLERAFQQVSSAVSRVRTLYVGRKIPIQTAKDALTGLDISATSADEMLDIWSLESDVNVKTLTAGEITGAWEYGAMTQDEAMAELQTIGYTPYDAWVLLCVKAKDVLDGKPERGPAPQLGQVVPGTT